MLVHGSYACSHSPKRHIVGEYTYQNGEKVELVLHRDRAACKRALMQRDAVTLSVPHYVLKDDEDEFRFTDNVMVSFREPLSEPALRRFERDYDLVRAESTTRRTKCSMPKIPSRAVVEHDYHRFSTDV